jgi:hypothetical protein
MNKVLNWIGEYSISSYIGVVVAFVVPQDQCFISWQYWGWLLGGLCCLFWHDYSMHK